MRDRELTRRQLLKFGGGAIVVAGVGGGIAAIATGGGDTADMAASGPVHGAEAPAFAALVKQGKLPPVAKRLPVKPPVVRPVERIGQYGGTWHTVAVGAEDVGSWMVQTVYYDNMVEWDPKFTHEGSIADVRPNLAESIDYNAAGTEYVFKLRQGLRWSDGTPFTAEDVVFAVNDIAVDKDVSPAPSYRFLGSDGSRCKASKIDRHTVKLTYPTPNSLFLQGMCSAGGFVLAAPSHYLKQFHAKYTHGLGKNWVEKFVGKNDFTANPDRPTVTAWMVTTPLGKSSQVVVERNPYYWKVDPQGRQLPYLDKVVFTIASDPEVALAQVLNGQVDLHSRTINTTRNKPVLADSRKKGDYHFFTLKTGFMNQALISFNETCKDPVKRKIFQNRNFRIGLSYAINRKEIIDSVYAGQGEPWQAAPRPNSPLYDEKMAKQFTEFDLTQANRYLDRSGYPMKGGARIGPDGKPISFVVLTATDHPDASQSLEFIKRTWKSVGIDLHVQNVDETLFFERVTANDHDAAVWQGDGGDNPILYPYPYIPTTGRTSFYASAWGTWYETYGKEGDEPPASVKQLLTTYDKVKASTDAQTQHDLMAQILASVRDQFLVIGIVLPPDGYGVVKNDFHNVPKVVPGELTYPNLGPTHPEQYFIA